MNFGKPDTPWSDVRVRRAINYCVDRAGLVTLLNGLAEPAVALQQDRSVFSQPGAIFTIRKGEGAAEEAGYGSDKPVKAKIMISTSGSGQMLPLPMNEFLQQNLKECNFDISFDVVDWGTMLVGLRNPPPAPEAHGDDAMNISLAYPEFTRVVTLLSSSNFPPNGFNWANWKNPEFDALVHRIEQSSDQEEILADIQKAHAVIVDDAPWLFIVHDRNPRAMTKHVKGFVSAQSWFQDFTPVSME
jgi:ABC-type transport system substrate-binding protein